MKDMKFMKEKTLSESLSLFGFSGKTLHVFMSFMV